MWGDMPSSWRKEFDSMRADLMKWKRKRQLGKRQVSRFCGQLATLLKAGVPLLESMRIVRGAMDGSQMDRLVSRLEGGGSLSEALKEGFPPLVVSSVRCAERTGSLAEVMRRLSAYYEERAEIEDRIKNALVYPCFVLSLCFISLLALFVLVLPGFQSLFADLDVEVPLITRMIMGAGEAVSRAWYVPLLGSIALAALFPRLKRTGMVDDLLFRVGFIRQAMVIQSFRTLGSLLNAGIPISEALATTADSASLRNFRQIILEVRHSVENGERMSNALSRYRVFPQEAGRMAAVGENSGTLADMLVHFSGLLEKEREVFIRRAIALLEPALTLLVGMVVAVIALAVFLPMMSMLSGLQ